MLATHAGIVSNALTGLSGMAIAKPGASPSVKPPRWGAPGDAGSLGHARASAPPERVVRGVRADPSTRGRVARWHGTEWVHAAGGKDRLNFLYPGQQRCCLSAPLPVSETQQLFKAETMICEMSF